jgi:hypothetical protein
MWEGAILGHPAGGYRKIHYSTPQSLGSPESSACRSIEHVHYQDLMRRS